jgi:hypothetical protein
MREAGPEPTNAFTRPLGKIGLLSRSLVSKNIEMGCGGPESRAGPGPLD